MILPPFDISGGLPLAFSRGVSVAGLLSVFGATLARVVLPPAPSGRGWRVLVWLSLGAALLGSAAWCWQVAATLADAPGFAATAATVPIVLAHTFFGHILLLRVALLALVAAACPRAPRIAATLAGLAVLTQAAHSHALSMHPGLSPPLLSDALHLLAAGAWLGGLLPLLLLVRAGPPALAHRACVRFSLLGSACVLVLAATALIQARSLIETLPAMVGTAYGLVASLKLLLFVALLGFAARNRFGHTPALATDAPAPAAARLVRSIAAETGIGLLVVLAAGVLTSLPPSMHTPTLWPFAVRPSLVTVQEDADFRHEVIGAVLALGLAAALLAGAALLQNRARWLAVAGAGAIAWFAVPHLDLLLVAAYPTSYQHSPTGFAAEAIVEGADLFPRYCATCHGAEGRGDGPAARTLPIPPADLTAAHLWMHDDGELIWWLSHGIDAPEGGLAMPGFAGRLSEPQLWALIDFCHAHNAGMVRRATGSWSPPIQAPDFLAGVDGRERTLRSLRGRVVRVVLGPPPAGTMPPEVTTVATQEPQVLRAYAIVAGLAPGEIAGSQFLVDAGGWLRAYQPGDAAPGWNDQGSLARRVAEIRAHPITAAGADDAAMPMQM